MPEAHQTTTWTKYGGSEPPKPVRVLSAAHPDLRAAEEAAGVRAISPRPETETIIDFCIVYPRTTEQSQRWRRDVASAIGSTSLIFEETYGGTTVGLSFDEANLARKAMELLRARGSVRVNKDVPDHLVEKDLLDKW